jgi:hypothetical protein
LIKLPTDNKTDLEANRDKNELKNGYQQGTDLVKDES